MSEMDLQDGQARLEVSSENESTGIMLEDEPAAIPSMVQLIGTMAHAIWTAAGPIYCRVSGWFDRHPKWCDSLKDIVVNVVSEVIIKCLDRSMGTVASSGSANGGNKSQDPSSQ